MLWELTYTKRNDIMTINRPNLGGIYGGTANPLRQVFMIGVIWRLAHDFGREPLNLVEVGSWAGASALTWGQGLRVHNNSRGSLICVDAWKPYLGRANMADALGQEINQALELDKPYQIFEENMQFMPPSVDVTVRRGWSAEVLPTLRDDSSHLIYLDGDHIYGAVAKDIKLACPLIRDGGIICGDDLELQFHELGGSNDRFSDDVGKCIDQKTGLSFHPGVARAVSEKFGEVSSWSGFWAMRRNGNFWVPVSLEGMPGQIPTYLDTQNLMGLKALLMQLQ